ncbi:MAG TPA: hypothetical protein VGB25_05195 [Candidatus Binatia bacterium]
MPERRKGFVVCIFPREPVRYRAPVRKSGSFNQCVFSVKEVISMPQPQPQKPSQQPQKPAQQQKPGSQPQKAAPQLKK